MGVDYFERAFDFEAAEDFFFLFFDAWPLERLRDLRVGVGDTSVVAAIAAAVNGIPIS